MHLFIVEVGGFGQRACVMRLHLFASLGGWPKVHIYVVFTRRMSFVAFYVLQI